MTKLSTWFAIAAVSLGLSATGCRRTPDKEDVDTSSRPPPSPKPTGSAAPSTPPAGGSGEAKPAEAKPGELPAECTEYTAAMDKLASCTAIPEATRNALKQTY